MRLNEKEKKTEVRSHCSFDENIFRDIPEIPLLCPDIYLARSKFLKFEVQYSLYVTLSD